MIRRAVAEDVQAIMEIVADAQSLLRDCGVDQWQDGYPTAEIILQDIVRNESYVVVNDGQIVGTAVISFAGEVTYNQIDGRWINDNPYAVIHRLAVRSTARGTGIAKQLFAYAEELCRERSIGDIRVDTHRDNNIMRNLLSVIGYKHCGEITLLSGAKRIALQKEL